LSVLHVENLQLHYAKTIGLLAAALDSSADQVARIFDDTFVRAWRLYLAGWEAFTTGRVQLFHVVFAPGKQQRDPARSAV
jgi:cyclopropane-fatty-acyl-phospholipid synthase